MHFNLSAAVLMIFGLSVACVTQPPELSRWPREISVLGSATDVRVSVNSAGSTELQYTLGGVPFPALGTTSLLRSRLHDLGWTRLTHDWLNPSNPLDWEFR